ncbi:PAS domain S-box protein [Ostertagia ostertagi]
MCSTAGEIYNTEVHDDTLSVTAISFQHTTVKTHAIRIEGEEKSFDAGQRLLDNFDKAELNYLLILSDGSKVNGSELVRAFNQPAYKDILITGGLAGDGSNFQSTLTGLNELPSDGMIVGIGFYGNKLQVHHGSRGGWDMFGLEKTVTRSHHNVLYEMDGKNAVEIYKKYLGPEAEQLPGAALLFPLAVTLPESGEEVVRTILSINTEEGSMTFAGDIPEGAKVRFMKANFDKITGAASGAAQQSLLPGGKMPQLAILISCVGRKLILQTRTDEELDAVDEIFQHNTLLTGAYERDIVLADHAFHIAEDEYREVNRQLKEELSTKEASINKLKEVVTNIGDSSLGDISLDNDLLSIASYLKEQIAKRAETEQRLQDQKTFYERILNLIPADIAIVDKDHRYLFVNPTAIKNPEIRSWIIGKTDEEYHHYRNKPIADTSKRKAHFYEVVKAGVQKEWEEKVVTLSGQTEYHLRVLHPVLKNDGTLDIMIIYGFNITERKKIEEQIKLSEARYRSIFDNSQALICTHDMNGVVLEVNQASVKAFGYDREELTGRPVYQLLPQDKQEHFRTSYLKTIRKEGKAEGVMIALNKEGKRIYLLYQNFMVAEQGEEPYVIGFSQDVTGRIEAEKALKKSEEKYRNIIANMNLGLVEVDPDEKIIYANNSFCEMSGYDQDELIGRNAATLLLKGDNQSFGADVSRRRREGESDAYEIKVKNKRGELKWWLISGAPVLGNDGSFQGSTGIHLDITLQKELEKDLREAKDEAERSAQAKELFLANMSHEIRTPMNAILGLGNLLMKTKLNDDQKYYLRTIHGAANNLLVIINDLLDFSKIEAGMHDADTIYICF